MKKNILSFVFLLSLFVSHLAAAADSVPAPQGYDAMPDAFADQMKASVQAPYKFLGVFYRDGNFALTANAIAMPVDKAGFDGTIVGNKGLQEGKSFGESSAAALDAIAAGDAPVMLGSVLDSGDQYGSVTAFSNGQDTFMVGNVFLYLKGDMVILTVTDQYTGKDSIAAFKSVFEAWAAAVSEAY